MIDLDLIEKAYHFSSSGAARDAILLAAELRAARVLAAAAREWVDDEDDDRVKTQERLTETLEDYERVRDQE